MYVYMCICVYVHMCIRIYIYVYIYIYIRMCVYVFGANPNQNGDPFHRKVIRAEVQTTRRLVNLNMVLSRDHGWWMWKPIFPEQHIWIHMGWSWKAPNYDSDQPFVDKVWIMAVRVFLQTFSNHVMIKYCWPHSVKYRHFCFHSIIC